LVVKGDRDTKDRDTKSTLQRDALGMRKHRVLLANAIIVLLASGSLFTVIVDKEYWPFSQYPMFSTLAQTEKVSRLQLYGVTQEEQDEIALRSTEYIHPFNTTRLDRYFRKINKTSDPEKRQQLLNEALLDSLKRYENLRLAGRHDGPVLQSMRLYKVSWQINARKKKVKKNQPERRELIAELEQEQDK
jgi:hypothetical protein